MPIPAEINQVNSTERAYSNSMEVNRAYGEKAMVTNIEHPVKDINVVTNMAYEQIDMTTNTVYGKPDAIKNEAYGKMENINNENENQEHRLMTSGFYDNVATIYIKLKRILKAYIFYTLCLDLHILCVIVAILKSRNNVGFISGYTVIIIVPNICKNVPYSFPWSPLYKPTLSFTI